MSEVPPPHHCQTDEPTRKDCGRSLLDLQRISSPTEDVELQAVTDGPDTSGSAETATTMMERSVKIEEDSPERMFDGNSSD